MSAVTAKSVLKDRDVLVGKYETATTAGVKAGLSRKIGQLDVQIVGLILNGDTSVNRDKFAPWIAPTTVRSSLTPMTEDEIRSALAVKMQVLTDPFTAKMDTVRHSADVAITGLLKSAETRGYVIADPRKDADADAPQNAGDDATDADAPTDADADGTGDSA